jgi:hypothetical protein
VIKDWKHFDTYRDVPVVPRSTYKDVGNDQCLNECAGDPWDVRPAIMRGAIHLMWGRYGKSRLVEDTVRRYFRRIRFTSFDFEEAELAWRAAARRSVHCSSFTREEAPVVGRKGFYYGLKGEGFGAWVGGKFVGLSPHQFEYLKRIHSIVKKTKEIEEKLEELAA